MLRAGRTWGFDDNILYETRLPRLAWENSPASATANNEGERIEQQNEPAASAAASAPPRDNTQDEDESYVYSFPADYEGPIDPDFDPYM